MINIEDVGEVTPTIFPDGTSQVWKLSDEQVARIQRNRDTRVYDSTVHVLWDYENEDELFHVCQLADLIRSYGVQKVNLSVPYLPYGRQDKQVSNETTFALRTFGKTIGNFFNNLFTFDAHSSVIKEYIATHIWIPDCLIEDIMDGRYNTVCYPDKGASERYGLESPFICMEKVRNQQTGEITGLQPAIVEGSLNPFEIEGRSVLIVDDICDGGRTFIETAKVLHQLKAGVVGLYVSHGIFSKGTKVLFDAGIDRVFTGLKGEIKNED